MTDKRANVSPRVVVVAVLVVWVLLPAEGRAGKLSDMGDEARGGSDPDGEDDTGTGGDDTCFAGDQGCNSILLDLLTSGDSGASAGNEGSDQSGRATVRAGYQYVFDNVHVAMASLMATYKRFEFNFGAAFYTEPVQGQRADHLMLAELGIGYRIVRLHRFIVHTGVGLRVMGDFKAGGGAGVMYTLGIACAPIDHFLVSIDGDVGNVGMALYTGGRGVLAFRISGFEVFAGWDAHVIGDVLFHGPLAGFGYRF